MIDNTSVHPALLGYAHDQRVIAQEQRFRETFEQATVGIAHLTLDRIFLRTNPKLSEILGYGQDELVGTNGRNIVHANDRRAFDAALETFRLGGLRANPIERRILRKDGSIVWLRITATLVRGEPGESDCLLGFYEDVTESKATQALLLASDARFRSYVEYAPIAVLVVGTDGRHLVSNSAALELLGYDPGQIATVNLFDTLCSTDCLRALEAFAALPVQETLRAEYIFERRDGARVPVSLIAVKLEEDRYLVYLEDFAVWHRAEAELRERLRLQEQLVRISESVPGVIFAIKQKTDGSYYVPFATSRIEDVFGLKPEDVAESATPLLSRVHIDDRNLMSKGAMNSAGNLSPWRSEYRYDHPVKGLRWIDSTSLPSLCEDGLVIWYGFAADITERKRDATALREASAVLAHGDDGIFTCDLEGIVTSVNAAFSTSTGYAKAEVVGRPIGQLRSSHHEPEFYAGQRQCLLDSGIWQSEIWLRRKNGESYPTYLTMTLVRDERGYAVNCVGSFTDLSRLKDQENRLETLANFDPLTGLFNRAVFLSRLGQALDRAKISGRSGAVLFLDLDRFKSVNDSLGHPAGDQVLRVLSGRLKAQISGVDTLARLGGDEFGIVLENTATAEDAALVAQALIETVLGSIPLQGGRDVVIGTSIGISLFPADSMDVDDLVRNADAALHQAKADGRGLLRFFSADLTRSVTERFELEGRLRRAIERREFVLHYQPVVSLADRSLKGVEALVRWEDPERGRIPPNQFIGLAEENGLIVPLGDWILRTACAQMQAWRETGVMDGILAVNLSPVQFRQRDIVDRVSLILAETGLPGVSLELEITEGALIGDAADAQATLTRLKALGVRLAIDDFGTGYSSLSYLKKYPIDTLKIDQSFVREIPNDPADMAIANAVISLAHSLRLESLAEGIETEEQLEFLKSSGCESGQGYLIARPMPAGDLAAFAIRQQTMAIGA